jgi:hypothetical protein
LLIIGDRDGWFARYGIYATLPSVTADRKKIERTGKEE